jgi:hypothetical protein
MHLLEELHAIIAVPINFQDHHQSNAHPCAQGRLLNTEKKLTRVIVLHPSPKDLAPALGVVGVQAEHLIKRSCKQNESRVDAKLLSYLVKAVLQPRSEKVGKGVEQILNPHILQMIVAENSVCCTIDFFAQKRTRLPCQIARVGHDAAVNELVEIAVIFGG